MKLCKPPGWEENERAGGREAERQQDMQTDRGGEKKEVKERLVAKCFRATIRRILRKLLQVSESGMRIRNASVRLRVKFAKVNQRREERRRDKNTRKQRQKKKKTKQAEGWTAVNVSAC